MKPLTSKHCMQYLTKESPFYQTKIAIKPRGTYRDVDGVVKDEDNKDAEYPIPEKKNKLKKTKKQEKKETTKGENKV